MKKFLAMLLAIVLCMSTVFTLVGCTTPAPAPTPAPSATLDKALEFFIGVYKDDEGKKTSKDFNLVSKVLLEDVEFAVTYTVDNENIKITLDEKTGMYVVDLPDENATEVNYTITATIKDAAGTTVEYKMKRVLAVYEAGVAGIVTEPVANTAYKLLMTQAGLGKVLFITAEGDKDMYLKTNIDPKVAPDWFVEVVDGGVKIYTEVAGVKMYMYATAAPREGQEGKFDKAIKLSADNSSVFKYKADINAWYTTINTAAEGAPVSNIDFAIGTYGTYDTLCISETSYYTPENTGVEQFPMEFITKEAGEAMAPTEGPADPTEVTPFADAYAIGNAKDHNTFTVEKYIIEGVITEIKNTQYGNMYISDGTNVIYIYGLYDATGENRYDAMADKPQVGDTIKVMGILGKYNSDVQMKNGWVLEKTAKVWTDAEKVAFEKDALTVGVINVAGDVTLPVAGATHADVTIAWALGETTLATLAENVLTVAALPTEAATITLTATLTLGTLTETKEITVSVKALTLTSIADANTEAAKHAHNTYTTDKYLIEGVITEIQNTQYGNMIISDGTNSILVYGLYTADGNTKYGDMADKPQVGDTIRVLGVLGTFSNTNQMKNGWLISMTAKVWNDQEKVDYEKAGLKVNTEFISNGTITLPDCGARFDEVDVTWTKDGVAYTDPTLAIVQTDAEQTIVLVATLALNDATATVTFTVKVSAKPAEGEGPTAYYLTATGTTGTVNYWNGTVSSGKPAAKADKAQAVKVYLEDAGDGKSYIYILDGSTKKYLKLTSDGTTKFALDTATKYAWTITADGIQSAESLSSRCIFSYNDQDFRAYAKGYSNGNVGAAKLVAAD